MTNFNLKPGTEKHTRIMHYLESRLRLSYNKMSQHYSKFQKIEARMKAYVPATDLDKERKARREGGIPDYTTIVVPQSYALLMTFHTYLSSVFLARTPVFQYSGRHGEPQSKVQALEALISYQTQVGGNLVPLYMWLYDAGKYSFGVIGTYWEETTDYVAEIREEPIVVLGIDLGKTKKKKYITEVPGYTGNKHYNVRPQDFFPDTRVPLSRFQDGEFCGRYFEEAWTAVYSKGKADIYQNVDFIRSRVKKTTSFGGIEDSTPETTIGSRDQGFSDETTEIPDAGQLPASTYLEDIGFLRGYELYVKLIPSMWGLGESDRQELWCFAIVPGVAILKARPYGAIHNRFPFDVLTYEMEAYNLIGQGLPEKAGPLEDTINWLINTHFYNVRKELNGTIVYNPMLIEEKRLLDPEPGGRIPLRPGAFSADIRTAIHQFTPINMTQNHLEGVEMIDRISQKVFGINENIMGMLATGGRKTATEVRHSSTFGVNRLKNHAEFMSAMGFTPLSQLLVQNSQQYYDKEMQFKLARGLAQGNAGDQIVQVTPDNISGFYDFIPVDGTMPVDKYALANLWRELLGVFRMLPPQALAQFDITRIITHYMTLAGATDVNQFKVQTQNPETISNAVQAGNLVEMPAARNPNTVVDRMGRLT